MDWRRLAMRAISEVTALGRLHAPPRAGLRVLMYHAVGSPVLEDERRIFGVAPDRFEAHMQALARYDGAAIASAGSAGAGELPMKVAITFDDGYRDNLHVAAPMLARHRFPFSVFAVSDRVRRGVPGFLSAAELRSLAAIRGATVGSHGASHIPLTQCDDRKLQDELVTSKRCLEDIIGQPVSALAYPYGAVDRRVRDAAERAGYALGFTSRFDINRPGRDPLLLSRTTILGTDSVRVFRQKLHGDWDWYRWRATDPAAA